MSVFKILHNPRCSKSRQTLTILREKGVEPDVQLYLDDVPTKNELRNISKMLGMKPIEFTRTREDEFKASGLKKDASDEKVFDLLVKHPKLIERPIVIKDGKQAVLGRPPENVLKLF